MIYGDTISFSHNLPRNWGVAGEYLLWDVLMFQAWREIWH
jgi:hypothetical protein